MTAHDDAIVAQYVANVAKQLRLRGDARRKALRELRTALRDAADDLGAAQAVDGFGSPKESARRLEQESTGGPTPTFFGVPVGIDPLTLRQRVRAAMDPNGPVLVPKILGAGWDLNFGRVLTALKLVRRDDLDEDVAGAIPQRGWRAVAAALALPYAVAVGVAASGVARMDEAPVHWPAVGPADDWGSPRAAFGPALAMGAAGVAAAVMAQNPRSALPARLTYVCVGASFVGFSLANTLMARWFGHRSGGWLTTGLLGGAAGGVLMSGALVRSGRARVDAEPMRDRTSPTHTEESHADQC